MKFTTIALFDDVGLKSGRMSTITGDYTDFESAARKRFAQLGEDVNTIIVTTGFFTRVFERVSEPSVREVK